MSGKSMNKPTKPAGGSLIVKDNKLINARYSLTVAEMRLFLSMVAQVRRDDKDFKTYRIKISDFVDTLGTSSKSIYERAREKSKQLMERVLEIDEPDGKLQLALLSSAKYYSGKGYVELRFDPALKPYLLQLKEKFTSYDIRYVLKLQSAHSMRIYELLKQYERIGERVIEVDELKAMLNLEGKYRSYNYFKKRVIVQAQEELAEKSDIRFNFDEIKEGRKVVKIRFIIEKKKSAAHPEESQNKGNLKEELVAMGLTPKQAEKFSGELDPQTISQSIAYVQKQYTEGKIKSSLGGYLKKILENGGVGESVIEKVAEEKASRKNDEKLRKEEEQQLIMEWWDAFNEVRKKQVDEMIKQTTEADWEEFETWVRANDFVRSRVIENGELQRDKEDTQFWLRSFLSDRLPVRGKAFVQWVYQETGYQLRRIQVRGEDQFEVIGKQGALFG